MDGYYQHRDQPSTRADTATARRWLVAALLLAGCNEVIGPGDAMTLDAVDASHADSGVDALSVDAGRNNGGRELDAGVDARSLHDVGTAADTNAMDVALGDVPAVDAGHEDDGGALRRTLSTSAQPAMARAFSPTAMRCGAGVMATRLRLVADAVELNGTCAVALDGHAFCWTSSGISSYSGTDAAAGVPEAVQACAAELPFRGGQAEEGKEGAAATPTPSIPLVRAARS